MLRRYSAVEIDSVFVVGVNGEVSVSSPTCGAREIARHVFLLAVPAPGMTRLRQRRRPVSGRVQRRQRVAHLPREIRGLGRRVPLGEVARKFDNARTGGQRRILRQRLHVGFARVLVALAQRGDVDPARRRVWPMPRFGS